MINAFTVINHVTIHFQHPLRNLNLKSRLTDSDISPLTDPRQRTTLNKGPDFGIYRRRRITWTGPKKNSGSQFFIAIKQFLNPISIITTFHTTRRYYQPKIIIIRQNSIRIAGLLK